MGLYAMVNRIGYPDDAHFVIYFKNRAVNWMPSSTEITRWTATQTLLRNHN